MHLNLYLARAGVTSRRKAVALIKEGRVTVNGSVVRQPYFKVHKEDQVKFDGQNTTPEEYSYIALNKPAGYTSTLSDRFAAHKIVDLLPESLGRLYPVGRLDKDSTGLIILTNDGKFAHRISHPRFGIEKEYEVDVVPCFNPADSEVMKKGVIDKGETLSAHQVKIIKNSDSRTVVRITIKEGKKREIKRLFSALGYRVERLTRLRIGTLILGSLPMGGYRALSRKEVQVLLALPLNIPGQPGKVRI
ncbi:MAG: pseudouridine synthase [Candidatus Omnitrophota bacterium]